jgi:hypothetical protein
MPSSSNTKELPFFTGLHGLKILIDHQALHPGQQIADGNSSIVAFAGGVFGVPSIGRGGM